MKHLVITIALLIASINPVLAEDAIFEVSKGWVKPTMPGKDLTAAFFELKNNTEKDSKLVAVESSIGTAEMHNTIEEYGVFKMRHMDFVELPANQTTVFRPRAKHIMLMNLPRKLKSGEEVTLVLHFENKSKLEVIFPVLSSMPIQNKEPNN